MPAETVMNHEPNSQTEQQPSRTDPDTRVAQLEELLRRKTEQLRETEAQLLTYENIFQAIPTPLFYKNLEGVYLNCNQAFADLKGIYLGDIIGKTVFDVTPKERAEDCNGIDEILKSKGKGTEYYEATVCLDHGERRTLMFNKALFQGANGNPAGLVCVISDITEIQRKKDELAKLKTQYRILLETIPHGIVELDTTGRISFANKAFLQIIGYGEKVTVEGQNFHELMVLDNNDEACQRECLTGFLLNGIPQTPCTIKIIDQRGKAVDLQLDWNYKHAEQGKPSGFILIVTDVTERNQAAQELERYQKRLRSLSSQLSLVEARERRKIATELHDNLGQDLALAKFKLKSLQADRFSSPCARDLASIEHSLEDAIAFTRSLTVKVSPLILYNLDFKSSVEWLAENILTPCRIEFRLSAMPQMEFPDEDSQVLLFETIRELLINIVKHAEAENVRITIGNAAGKIQVSIDDDGKGFGYTPECGLEDYSGFGLFSIRERITYLKGNLEVVSSLGQGTCIRFDVPLSPAKTESAG